MSMAIVRVTVGTGRTFYVAANGSDSNPGTQAQPFRTINRAVSGAMQLRPGDTVIVKPGTYTEQVWFAGGGDASGYVTLRSETKHAALIRPSGGYSAINIQASHVTVDGFDVVGGGGHGIAAEASGIHHIRILNNRCHDSGGSGISCTRGEFYTIEGNVCHGNSNTNGFHTSGISIYQARTVAGDSTTTGFRNVVRSNICYNNQEITAPTPHTDGNGIIIDDFNNTQGGGEPGGYPYPTLLENNLCFDNGGKGIQLAWSNNVMVRNNTCYHNNKDTLNPGTWRGELSNAICNANVWVNNIGVANPGSGILANNAAVNDTGSNSNVVWRNNLTYNGTPGQRSVLDDGTPNPTLAPGNGHAFGADPLFVKPGTDPSADFRLQAGSPALNVGTSAFGVAATDLDGSPRVFGAVDMGCYERQD